MNILNVKVELARSKKLTFQIIRADNVVNWVLGLALILVPDLFNRILFGHEVISHWIYIIIGVGLIWFASWQIDNLLKERQLSIQALRLSAFLAWMTVLILIWILLSGLGSRMLLVSEIILWLIDLSMLFLGGWYWWMAEQVKVN
jgi:hypothetical protein